jgi:hypothetical protein
MTATVAIAMIIASTVAVLAPLIISVVMVQL